tara:strand:- start:3443 stop:3661 length:219 start_codon:yes stop_codon:yes gene_type:complete
MFKRFNTVGELLTYLSTLPEDMAIHTESEVMNFEPGVSVGVEEVVSMGIYVSLPDEDNDDNKIPVLLVDGRG